jgi:hypothetical protein
LFTGNNRFKPPQLEFTDYSSDGDLRLDEYQAMGGMSNVIRTEIESILSPDPEVQKAELGTLHVTFIAWLAAINPKNNRPIRGVARMHMACQRKKTRLWPF